MHQETPDLTEIAVRIFKNTAILKDFLNARGFPQPSFAANAAPEFPNPNNESGIQLVRESILEDTKTLSDLVMGPAERLKWTVWPVIEPLHASLRRDPVVLTASS